jgi:hypothetical protein
MGWPNVIRIFLRPLAARTSGVDGQAPALGVDSPVRAPRSAGSSLSCSNGRSLSTSDDRRYPCC